MVVYPRWRGELVLTDKNNTFCGGLSPLARGTLFGLVLVVTKYRFIPASAGNSGDIAYRNKENTVYPR